jgi:hypothetical protein
MDRFDDDTLIAELRELRPTARPEFTAELDQRAAAGFPRGERPSASAMRFAKLADRWRGMNPRRHLVPVLGTALAAVLVATAAVAFLQSIGPNGGSSSLHADEKGSNVLGEPEPMSEESAESSSTGGGIGGQKAAAAPAAKGKAQAQPERSPEESESYIEAQQNLPDVEVTAGAAGAGKGQEDFDSSFNLRDIERSAYIILGTKPSEVSGAAAKVYEAVHAVNGVVLHSSVQSGNGGATGASFDLLIPCAKLNDALATFSSIAEVRQRHDATDDITAPTVSAAEELADSNASIEGLLKQLGEAETETEQESVEARLHEERRRHAAIRASLEHLHQRASMSEVSVRIVTNHGAGVAPPSKDDDGWGVGDALHSAGQILTIAAGVVLIGLAVLAPFALIALLIWAGNRFRVRRLRERTLG